jgi:hypothetical protein
MDVMTLAALLRETEGRHGRYEPIAPAQANDAASRAGRYTEAARL